MKTLLLAIVLAFAPAHAASQAPDSRPDITEWANDASLAQLEEVKGIGSVLAARIVAARPFASVTNLAEVKGIGPVILARIAAHVSEIR